MLGVVGQQCRCSSSYYDKQFRPSALRTSKWCIQGNPDSPVLWALEPWRWKICSCTWPSATVIAKGRIQATAFNWWRKKETCTAVRLLTKNTLFNHELSSIASDEVNRKTCERTGIITKERQFHPWKTFDILYKKFPGFDRPFQVKALLWNRVTGQSMCVTKQENYFPA